MKIKKYLVEKRNGNFLCPFFIVSILYGIIIARASSPMGHKTEGLLEALSCVMMLVLFRYIMMQDALLIPYMAFFVFYFLCRSKNTKNGLSTRNLTAFLCLLLPVLVRSVDLFFIKTSWMALKAPKHPSSQTCCLLAP